MVALHKPYSILEKARGYTSTSRAESTPDVFDSICSTRKYAVIRDEVGLRRLAEDIRDAKEVAVDLETSGLDPFEDTVEYMSLATASGLNALVSVRAVDIRPLLKVLEEKTLLLFNAKFDLKFLMHHYAYHHTGEVVDLMVLFMMVHYGKEGERTERARGCLRVPDPLDKKSGKKVKANLAYVAGRYLGSDCPEIDKSHQKRDWTQSLLPPEMVEYALTDSRVLLPLYEELLARLKGMGMAEYPSLEGDSVMAVAWCELNGTALDEEEWLRIEAENRAKADKTLEEVKRLSPLHPDEGAAWNFNSPSQRILLLKVLGADTGVLPKTPTGQPSTAKKSLGAIEGPEPARKWVEAWSQYNEANSLAEDFGKKWLDPKWFRKGRLHADYKPLVSTGRHSCQDPPLQQMPKQADARFRRAFRAPKGRTLVVADFKQVELVIGAEIAGEEKMQRAFRDPDTDLHTQTASEVFDLGGKEVSEEEMKRLRDLAKPINFGIFYGLSGQGLQKRFKEDFGIEVALGQAEAYIKRVLGSYKSIADWQRRVRHECERLGMNVVSTPLGRKRILPVWETTKRVNVNAAFNHPIQGAGPDALKLTIGKLYRHHTDLPGDPKLVGMVHDEVIVEVDEDATHDTIEALTEYMTEAVKRAVKNPDCPVAVDIEVREAWGKE